MHMNMWDPALLVAGAGLIVSLFLLWTARRTQAHPFRAEHAYQLWTAGIAGGYLTASIALYQLDLTTTRIFASNTILAVSIVPSAWALCKMTTFRETPLSQHLTPSQLRAMLEFELAAYGEVVIDNPAIPKEKPNAYHTYCAGYVRVPAKGSTFRFVMHSKEWESLYHRLLMWNIPTWTKRYEQHVKYSGNFGPYAKCTRFIRRPQGVSVGVAPHEPRRSS
jgi:hypothetical protein